MQGFRSGKLTQGEFFRLMDEQRDIRGLERRVLANGIMTQREFDQLNVALDQADKHIFSEKHDRDSAYNNPPPRPFSGPAPWNH
jgi:hypothetical protein